MKEANKKRAAQLDALERNLRRLMWQERVWLKSYLHAFDLDLAPFMALNHLAHLGGIATIAELVEHLGQRNTTMTGHLDRLQDKGLVTRKFGKAKDRRMVSVRVTAKGATFLERAQAARRARIARGCAEMSADQIQHLAQLLEVYLHRVEQAK